MGRAFINSTQNSLAGILWDLGKSMGPTPGVKTPITPDVVDAVDAGDVVEGVGVYGWRRVRRARRVGWWLYFQVSRPKIPEYARYRLQSVLSWTASDEG